MRRYNLKNHIHSILNNRRLQSRKHYTYAHAIRKTQNDAFAYKIEIDETEIRPFTIWVLYYINFISYLLLGTCVPTRCALPFLQHTVITIATKQDQSGGSSYSMKEPPPLCSTNSTKSTQPPESHSSSQTHTCSMLTLTG